VFISTVRQGQAAAERERDRRRRISRVPARTILGCMKKSCRLSQNFVERYRCLPDGESRNRVSMDRLQSGSFFMIPGRRGEKPERENAERKTK
jgi:hypothetical protein